MIKIINIENAAKEDILTRDIKLESGVEAIVADIIRNVRENGDKALKEYALKFDKAEIENVFGAVQYLKRDNQAENEIAFVTPVMKEGDFNTKLRELKINLITTIRISDY